jgi:hypothetical protein
MALIDGDDFILGSLESYQQNNRIKNHWRGPTAPTNPQPGMLFSDADDNKLYHYGDDSIGWDEILQAARSFDATPIFNNLILDVDASDVTDPPTAAELNAIFGATPGDGFIGLVQDTSSGGSLYLAIYSGGWWVLELALAA